MKKIVSYIIILMLLLTNGCIEKKVSVINEESIVNKYVVYNLGKLPEDLLLLNSSKVREKDLLLALFEGLVKTDASGNVIPAIAESWIISTDEITYDFKLRESAKWSDGSDITAEDFVGFFASILDSKTDNIYAKELYCIFGASEFNKAKKAFTGVAIKAVGNKQLQIRLNAPTQNFLHILSQPIYALRNISANLKNWRTDYKKLMYSGPFIIGDLTNNGEVILNKNNNYYNKEEVKSEIIYLTSIESSEESLASFRNYKINAFANPPMPEINTLVVNEESEEITINGGSSINFNMKKARNIKEESFRKAISQCIDRNEIAVKYLNGIARSASAYVPFQNSMSNLGVRSRSMFKDIADYAEAKKLLAESKYNEKEKLKLVYLISSENKKICEGIAKDVKEALGVNITAIGVNEELYGEVLKNGDYDLIKADYTSNYNDSMSLLEKWTSNSEENVYGYKNTEFDSLISKARYEKDKSKRAEMLKNGEEMLVNDLPLMPLYFRNLILCRKENVKGLYATKEGNIKLEQAYIE
jgi:peptide/nickel transport system substrate-binding protein